MTWAMLVGGIIFLVGVLVGALLSRLYPERRDAVFREYLKREYGVEKENKR